jgi:hypothetical protein
VIQKSLLTDFWITSHMQHLFLHVHRDFWITLCFYCLQCDQLCNCRFVSAIIHLCILYVCLTYFVCYKWIWMSVRHTTSQRKLLD